jgi:hypothetical protein
MRVTTGVVLWLAAAAAATAVGLFAVGAIGTDIFGPSAGEPLSQSEVDAQLSRTPPPSSTSTPPSSVPPSTTTRPVPQAGKTESVRSAGGTVWARCVPGGVEVVGSAPAQGYQTDRENEGIDDHPHVRFRDGSAEVEVRLRCVGGHIQPEIRDK